MEKEEKKKGKDKSKDKAEKSQYVEVKNEPLSEDDDVPLVSVDKPFHVLTSFKII